MPEEKPVPAAESTEAAPAIPTDFKQYEEWRKTGELPSQDDASPAAAEAGAATQAPEPPAKTEPDSEPEDTEPDEEEEQEGKRGSSRQRKIDKLTRENEEFRRILAALVPQPAQPAAPAAAKAEPEGGKPKPKLNDFETLEQFQEALTDWKLDQREAARVKAENEQKIREAVEKQQSDWAAKERAARKQYPDFDEALGSVKQPENSPGKQAMISALHDDENGALILYYLAKNPDELKRIAKANPLTAVREIGKLSARFNSSTSNGSNGNPKSAAVHKPPPEMNHPAGRQKRSLDDPNISFPEYEAERTRMKRR